MVGERGDIEDEQDRSGSEPQRWNESANVRDRQGG